MVNDVGPQDLEPSRVGGFGSGRGSRVLPNSSAAAVDDTAQQWVITGTQHAAGAPATASSPLAFMTNGHVTSPNSQSPSGSLRPLIGASTNTNQAAAIGLGGSNSSTVLLHQQQQAAANGGPTFGLQGSFSSSIEQLGGQNHARGSLGSVQNGPTPLGEARESFEQQQQTPAATRMQATDLRGDTGSGRSTGQQQQEHHSLKQQLFGFMGVRSSRSSLDVQPAALSLQAETPSAAAAAARELQLAHKPHTASPSPQSTSERGMAVVSGSAGANHTSGMVPVLGPGMAILQRTPNSEMSASSSGHAVFERGRGAKGKARHGSDAQSTSFSTGTGENGGARQRTEVQVCTGME